MTDVTFRILIIKLVWSNTALNILFNQRGNSLNNNNDNNDDDNNDNNNKNIYRRNPFSKPRILGKIYHVGK